MWRRQCPVAGMLGSMFAASRERCQQRWNSCDVSPQAPAVQMVSGDPSRGVTAASKSSMVCTDFVGSTSAPKERLSAGDLMGLMDIAAARTAMFHITGRKLKPATAPDTDRSSGGSGAAQSDDVKDHVSVATVAADRTMFYGPLLHGDLVSVTGRVVHAGSSAVGVHIGVNRLRYTSDVPTAVAEAFFSMVAITKSLKSAKVVPAVSLTTAEEVELHHTYARTRSVQKDNAVYYQSLETRDRAALVAQLTADSPSATTTTEAAAVVAHRSVVPVASTETYANRLFFSGYLNHNQTIFGGEILRWMESHAVHCGRCFTRNRHVYTIGMHSVSFNNPIFLTDWVTLRARVTLVRNTTMEVDVKISVEREGAPLMTNRASFVLINVDDVGAKLPITTGLALEGATEKMLRQCAMAKYRYEQSKQMRDERSKPKCDNHHHIHTTSR